MHERLTRQGNAGRKPAKRIIKVLIVDDSALMRSLLADSLALARDIEVIGCVADAATAREQIKRLNPDVITLDIEMPGLDGLSFLERIMRLRPAPVIMISSLTQRGAADTLRALEAGAVDVVGKPVVSEDADWLAFGREIVSKVRAASRAHVQPVARPSARPADTLPAPCRQEYKLVALAASTGGVAALKQLLQSWPPAGPPVVVTQHMPANFSAVFAARLDGLTQVAVQIAEHGQRILPGYVYVAPGDSHLTVIRRGAHLYCALDGGPPVNGHAASADVMFHSVADAVGDKAVGAILTGMGKDGAAGLKAMRYAGAVTFGQDEASSLIYGMPGAAKRIGAVMHELALAQMPAALLEAACAGIDRGRAGCGPAAVQAGLA